jgi:hypothetical protein
MEGLCLDELALGVRGFSFGLGRCDGVFSSSAEWASCLRRGKVVVRVLIEDGDLLRGLPSLAVSFF